MPVVRVGIRTLRHKDKEIAAGEYTELLRESMQAGRMYKKTRNVLYVTRWITQKEGSAGNEETWYIDSKGHFEYVSGYKQLTSERN